MLQHTLVGPASSTTVGQGTTLPVRSGGQGGDVIVSELHGAYYEQCYRGNVFNASLQAVGTTTVGLATTYTGLVISNPITSTVNMVLLQGSVMQSVIQSVQIEAFAIAVGNNSTTNVTHTAALTPRQSLVGGTATPQGLADTSATLPTAPFYHTFVSQTSTATADGNAAFIDLKGSIILRPGAYALWVTPAQASVAGMWFSFVWEEVPV